MNRTLPGLLLGALVPVLVLAACGDETGTAECAKLPLYDVREATLDPALLQQLVEQGCITAPVAPSSLPSASR